ncbi:MAG: energy transducer TonB [Proteobacteria bacterium]|nr:energy transducer TonB [Pseudomonadota bacterium]
MKRLLVAIVLALMFHAGLMALNLGWFFEKNIKLPKADFVEVTISYREPPPKPVVKIKKVKPVEKPKIKPKKTVIPPKKIEPIPVPVEEIILPDKREIENDQPEIISEPVEDNKDNEEIEEETDNIITDENISEENNTDDDIATANVIREAYPLYKTNPPPAYPRIARRRGYQGIVILNVLVDENGRVKNLKLFTSSGHSILDKAALNSVKTWVFEPGTKGRSRMAMWVRVPIRFELK